MPSQQIPLIMEIIDNIVSPDDRKRKYTDRRILKVLIVLQLFNISYRSARMIDLHAINNEIASLYSIESIAAIDSFMIHTCIQQQ